MRFNYEEEKLPPVYTRNGKKCYLDPIRERLIYITPEETVRQKVICFLINKLNVPINMIAVEEPISHYGIDTRKRADIIIHKLNEDGLQTPIAVIECKAPDIYLCDRTATQMIEYCDMVECDYAMMINGNDCFCYKYSKDKNIYIKIEEFPDYKSMTEGAYIESEVFQLPPRIPFDKLGEYLDRERNEIESGINNDIGIYTDRDKAIVAFNLLEGFYDTRKKLPERDYSIFKLIEDYGVRILTYGNPSGGKFFGPYRSFLIEYNGNVEFVSMSITTYWKSTNPDNIKTCLVVAIDNEKTSHHALQLIIDDNVKVDGEKVEVYHHGRISIGNMGSGKIGELKLFVNRMYPKIISNGKIHLGNLANNRLWSLDDSEVINLVENLISYALVRDEYRKYVKLNKTLSD